MFIRRNGLLSELAADPVGGFGHDDLASRPKRRQSRRATAKPAAGNDDVGLDFANPRGNRISAQGKRPARSNRQEPG